MLLCRMELKAHTHLPCTPALRSLVSLVLLDSLLQNQKRDSDEEADGCILQSERARPGATSAPGAISLLIVAMQGAVSFDFEGDRIWDTNTPAQLDMYDGDVIDAYLQQVGD